MNRFEIDVVLVAASVDRFLVGPQGWPSLPLRQDGLDSKALAGELLRATLGIEPNWVLTTQAGFVDRGDRPQVVLYFAAVPEPVLPRDPLARWVTFRELMAFDPETLALAQLAVQYKG